MVDILRVFWNIFDRFKVPEEPGGGGGIFYCQHTVSFLKLLKRLEHKPFSKMSSVSGKFLDLILQRHCLEWSRGIKEPL